MPAPPIQPRRVTSDALHQRVQAFVRSSMAGAPSEPFDALACDIARFQAAHVPAVARLFAARGVTELHDARDIPAVVTEAFRMRRIAAHPSAEDARCFATSGTTGGRDARGLHPMRRTDSYAAGALAWGRAMLWPDRTAGESLGFSALVSDETQAPQSSLSFMLARFAEALSTGGQWLVSGARLDVDGVVRACHDAARHDRAMLLAGTAFAFVHLEDALGPARLALPAGSRVMQTGGFKGMTREVDSGELREAIARRFAIPRAHVVGEYGMTELASQLYQGGLGRGDDSERYWAPPWLCATAVDPVSLEPLPSGALGLARFVDLANIDSAVAIQTADRIVVDEDGALTLHGRQPGATPRGCSLALEHLLEDG